MPTELVQGRTEPLSVKEGVAAPPGTVPDLDSRLAGVTGGAAIFTAAVASLVIVGWIVDSDVLKRILPGFTTMKFNTALCFLAAACSLWLTRPRSDGWRMPSAARATALAVAAVGVLTLLEYVAGLDLAIDQWFIRDLEQVVNPGRMSAASTVAFILLGGSLFALTVSRAPAGLSQALAFVVVMIGLVGAQGYVYGVRELHQIFLFSSVALHTSILFVVVGIGTMCARPDAGIMAVAASPGPGARLIRRQLLPLVLVQLALGAGIRAAAAAGFYGDAVGVALFGTANLVLVGVVAWRLAARLDQAHTAREASHARVAASARALEDLRTALDEHAIVAFTDATGRITGVNGKFCAISGYSEAELIGGDHRLINAGYHSSAFMQDLWQTISSGRPWHGEIQNRSKSGAPYWVATTIVPFIDETAQPTRYIAIHTDITERKELEAALRAGEARFRALVESLPLLIFTCQPDGSCDYVSPQWVAYTGVPEQAQLGFGWMDAVHPDDRAGIRGDGDTAAAAGGAFDVEFRMRRHDGVYRWFKTRATPIRDASGTVLRWIGSAMDIQDLRAAEASLRQVNRDLEARVRERTDALAAATERIQLATAAAHIGIWDWNVRDDTVTWDSTMYRLYGMREEDFTGAYDAWRSAVHPDDLPGAEEALRAAIAGRKPFDTAFRIVLQPSRSIRHLRGAAVVHTDPDGRPSRMVGINWDVTEQREAEQALRAGEQLLREFVAHAPAAIAMLDRDMRYLQASERWLSDYGLTGNIIGRSHYDVFPDLPERWKEVHRRVLAGRVEQCDDDPFPRADGAMEWLQWEARPWLTSDGSVGGLLFFTQMITARKQLELELQTKTAALERSNAELEQFAYVASHDLQEPLRAVAGCSQILQRRYRGQLDAAADELIGHIVDGADRMHNLIQDLLAYSRVDRQHVLPVPTAAGEALQRAMANLTAAIREAGAEITHDALPTIAADPAQLTQLFQNLIGNAVKYRDTAPPRVHVAVQRADDEWRFSVRDNGIGIDPEYFDRIFSLFQRLHTRAEYPGTGIGLAICKKIVQRHGGRMWVESTPGHGSTFYFTLPVSTPEPAHRPARRLAPRPARRSLGEGGSPVEGG